MSYLTRDLILKVGLQRKEVDVPEWGGKVLVRELTSLESEKVAQHMMNPKTGKMDVRLLQGLQARIVGWATIKENGDQLFMESDVRKLEMIGTAGVSKVANAILDLSGMSVSEKDEDETEKKDEVDEAVKN